jgi:hypothetical protein
VSNKGSKSCSKRVANPSSNLSFLHANGPTDLTHRSIADGPKIAAPAVQDYMCQKGLAVMFKQIWLNKHDSSKKQNDREDFSHFNCKLRRIKNKLQLLGLYQHDSKYI